MKHLVEKAYQNIGKLAIYYGLIAMAAHILGKSFSSLRYLTILAQPHFRDVTKIINSRNFGRNIQWLDILFFAMMIAGGLLYQKTDKKDARLLRFTFSIIGFKGVLSFIQNSIMFRHLPTNFLEISVITAATLYTLLAAFFGIKLTQKLVKNQRLFVSTKGPNNETYPDVIFASKKKRFAHFIFDLMLTIILLLPFVVSIIARLSHRRFSHLLGSNMDVLPYLILPGLILYYLFFEGLFGATPTKFLTGSAVISTNTVDDRDMSEFLKNKIPNRINAIDRPNFGQILGRTFARRIPFEPWSFFGKNGWHDTLSKTAVIVENTGGVSRRYHGWWPVLFFGIYIGSMAYAEYYPRYLYKRQSSYRKEIVQQKRASLIANLNAGDILKVKLKNANYKKATRLFSVLSTNEQFVTVGAYSASPLISTNKAIRNFFANNQVPATDTIQVPRDKILNAFYGEARTPIHIGTNDYFVENIYDLDQPEFKGNYSLITLFENNSPIWRFQLRYDNTPIDIVSIKNIKGNLKWLNKLPLTSNFNLKYQTGTITLKSKSYGDFKTYKAEIVLKYDEMNHTYILEGMGGNSVFYRKGVE